ncbi:MAG: protein arginine kinase [Verrucomicrobia bacterium]|nr:protein arginine kinase [Verrucomicrobiota bacterium]
MPAKLPSNILEHTPWEKDQNPIWLATSLSLLRNFARYKFPSKLVPPQTSGLLQSLQQTLTKFDATFLPADQTSALDREFLFEHFLCQGSFQNATDGQGFAIDSSGQLLALCNIKNHLQLHWLDVQSSPTDAWTKLSRLESEIGKNLDFAFSPKFGYLTSDPTECGTGLIVTFFLHLPALIRSGKLPELLTQKDEDILPMSFEGPVDELVGDILLLRNQYTLGLTEENIMQSLQNFAFKLIAAEKALRSQIKEKKDPNIKDHVSRAYGLLVHSYQLQTKEALNALSLIKLGIDLGWITNVSSAKINQIFFQCRRGHLAHLLGETTLDFQEIPRKRAEFIHKSLQGMQIQE